jgi:SH3 domain-containing YSC84-like protein 1
MPIRSGISKYVLCIWASIALLSLSSWAQNDQATPTTTETPSKPSAAQERKASQKRKESSDDVAKFDKKTDAENSKNDTEIVKRMNTAAGVLDEIMGTPDKGIPKDLLADSKCIIVIPSMIHIAVGFGGQHSSKFKIGAEATGAAGPVGREVSGNTDWKLRAEMLTYSRSRGLFAGINLNGASIKQDRDETALLYGKVVPFETVLSGKVPPPSGSHTFLATVHKYANEAAREKQGE